MTPTPEGAPLSTTLSSRLAAQAASGTANSVVGEAPFDATVTAVTLAPDANITGATATKRTFTLLNRGQDGSGATSIAVLDLTTGVNPVSGDEMAFTLSGTPANLNINAGDILSVQETVASTGTANPGGRVSVDITRR